MTPHLTELRIRLLGGPGNGTVVPWRDRYPPSRWLADIPGQTGRPRRRSVYRPVKTGEGAFAVDADGVHAYRYVGEELL